LLLNTTPNQKNLKQGEISMSIMESVVKIVDAKPVTSFAKLNYSITTTEIERIAVDHVARDAGGVISQCMSLMNYSHSSLSMLYFNFLVAAHCETLHQSIKMLHIRISVLKSYLEAVKAGTLPADQGLLREINSVCQQLPAIESGEFNEAFFTVCFSFLLFLKSIFSIIFNCLGIQ
jgi:hypothetical protein